MNKIYYLNLPELPEKLYTELVESCTKIKINEESRKWVHNFQRGELNTAGHEYGNSATILGNELTNELNLFFKQYFADEKLYFLIGRLSNVVGLPSSSPPHCDRLRKIAINYLLKNGGAKVSTCFYKESRSNSSLEDAENRYYKDCTLDYKIILPIKTWHCYDVQYFHSVEDIENDRFIFSIVLNSNPTIKEFVSRYKNLLNHETV